MPSVEDLGRKIKQENPGEYDEFTDYDVGILAKEEYPDKYSEYGNTSLSVMESYVPAPLTSSTLNESQIETIVEYYKPTRGRFTSWWQKIKSGGRTRLLTALNREEQLAIEQGAMLEQAIRDGRKNEIDFKIFVAQNAGLLLAMQHNGQLIEQAMASGLSVDDDGKQRLEKLTVENIIHKHERISEIDAKNRWVQIKQDLDAADLYETSEQSIINKLTDYLREMLLAKHAVEVGKDPYPVKKRLLAQYDKNIESLEARINARNGLVSSKNEEENRRPIEENPNSREDS